MTARTTASATLASGAATPGRAGTRIAWVWVLLSSIGIAAFAVAPYLTASLRELAASSGGLAANYADQAAPIRIAFYAHICGGGLALLLGPLQFWRRVRERWPRAHRWIGRVYLLAVGVGGLAGLVLAPVNAAGLIGVLGFGSLALLWLLTGWLAYRAIRKRDIPGHRAWMMRNFALSYAAVTLRIWLPLLILAQLPFASAAAGAFDFDAAFAIAYPIVPFLCWVPNLVVAEWLVARRGLPAIGFRRVGAVEPGSR